MWKQEQYHGPGWFIQRLKRHFGELMRLAVPAMMMRVGILSLGVVDTAMVGHYATEHLAWLNLANQSVVMFALVVGLGLLTGVVVYTANAFGAGDRLECGRVWRRTLPFTLAASLIMLAVSWPAEYWLSLMGQTPEKSYQSGGLIRILILGVPGHLLFANCTMFLEGVKRPHIGFYLMLVANIANVILNYALIYGNWGMPEMGATGSAWASTGVRWIMALSALAYVWYAPGLRQYGVRRPVMQKWRDWADQRQMGYAAAVSLAAEVIAFGALAIFAGWIGTIALAAQGVMYQLLGLPLMAAIGVGIASSVRAGISFARRDRIDTMLAGLSGVMLTLIIAAVLAVVMLGWVRPLLGIFTEDDRILDLLVPLAPWFTVAMIFDALQMTISSTLRGVKETWWPTALQTFTFLIVMLPASYILTFSAGLGLKGLVVGTFIGVLVSFALQVARFAYLVRAPNGAGRPGRGAERPGRGAG